MKSLQARDLAPNSRLKQILVTTYCRLRKQQLCKLLLAVVVLLPQASKRPVAAPLLRALSTPAILVKAPDKAILISICRAGNRLVAAGEHGIIIYSDDDGATWRQSAVPVDATLTAVAFAGSLDGWAVGHFGVILRTADGGLTWHKQLDGLGVNQLTLEAAKLAVRDHDQSVGVELALKRATKFSAAGPDKPFLALLVVSRRSLFSFGAYRMTVKSDDGGVSWEEISLRVGDPLSHHLYDVAASGTDIYVVGEAGVVFRSTDRGKSFPAIVSPSSSTLFSVVALGDGALFVCGVAGSAFRSDDYGKTWTHINLNTRSNLTAARQMKSGAIAVLGESGDVYVSTDRAKSFSKLPKVQPMALYDATEGPSGDLVTVGSLGVAVIRPESLSTQSSGE